MKILITGGAGYIGTMLTHKLLQETTHDVTIIDNFMYGNETAVLPFLLNSRVEIRKADLLDSQNYKELLDFDIVVHLAALVGFPLCESHQTIAEQLNFGSVVTLLKNIRKDALLIYPTTNSGYGITKGDEVCTEDTPLNPVSLYGITKKKAEEYIAENHSNSIRLRLATVFGLSYRMRNDLLVNSFVWKAYKDKYNVIYDGHAKRNYIHIQDVADVFLFAIKNQQMMSGKVFNVGNDSLNMDKLSLATFISTIIPHKLVEGDVGVDPDKRNYIVSSKKLYDLGYSCKYDLEFGVRELLKAFKIVDKPVNGNY